MSARLKIDFPDIVAVMQRLGLTAALALTRGMEEATAGWKNEIRPQIRSVFKSTPAKARKLGLNFEKSFQGTSFPQRKRRKVSFRPAGFLNAKAAFAEIFETGGGVSPRHAKYRAIALPAARRLGFDYGYAESGHGLRFSKRSMVEDAERQLGPFRPIPGKHGNKILGVTTAGGIGGGFVAKGGFGRGKVTAVQARGKKRDFVALFVLVKTTVEPKKLNFMYLAQKWANALPDIVRRITGELMAQRDLPKDL
jgi:hypothetical protein